MSHEIRDNDSYITLSRDCVHSVHVVLKASFNLDFKAIVALDMRIDVVNHATVTAAGTRSATALSTAAAATHPVLVVTGAIIGGVLTLSACVFTLRVALRVKAFLYLASCVAWLTALPVVVAGAEAGFVTGSALLKRVSFPYL